MVPLSLFSWESLLEASVQGSYSFEGGAFATVAVAVYSAFLTPLWLWRAPALASRAYSLRAHLFASCLNPVASASTLVVQNEMLLDNIQIKCILNKKLYAQREYFIVLHSKIIKTQVLNFILKARTKLPYPGENRT